MHAEMVAHRDAAPTLPGHIRSRAARRGHDRGRAGRDAAIRRLCARYRGTRMRLGFERACSSTRTSRRSPDHASSARSRSSCTRGGTPTIRTTRRFCARSRRLHATDVRWGSPFMRGTVSPPATSLRSRRSPKSRSSTSAIRSSAGRCSWGIGEAVREMRAVVDVARTRG